jgi:CRP-like cAMP-binding protein
MGESAGLALIGWEGLLGLGVALGDERTVHDALVSTGGMCFSLPAKSFGESFDRSRALRKAVLRYVSSLVAQMAQTALCNSQHRVGQRFRRWLLQMLDRVPPGDLRMTQDSIGMLLGVRRETVTIAALRLQARGAIRYTRGNIRVLSRTLVQEDCCECYGVLKDEFDRLTHGPASA